VTTRTSCPWASKPLAIMNEPSGPPPLPRGGKAAHTSKIFKSALDQ
jgi:hypothetical protein